jgi:DNA-binding beta-propeller fold protein YncE
MAQGLPRTWWCGRHSDRARYPEGLRRLAEWHSDCRRRSNSSTYGTTLNTIYLGSGGTDELDYDPVDHKVYVTDVADHTVASVDAIHSSSIKAFTSLADDQIEQPRYNPSDGMFYINFRATNQIAKFDPHADSMVSLTSISVPCTPSGIAIKATTNMALLGCRLTSQGLVFWNLATNSLDHTIPNVSGADQVIYNAKADRFFAAASRWQRGASMAILDGSGNFINVPTSFASHQVGYDQPHLVVYTVGGGLISFTLAR